MALLEAKNAIAKEITAFTDLFLKILTSWRTPKTTAKTKRKGTNI